MQLKTVRISGLKQHPKNPNNHPVEQINELQESLDQFDQVKNIVVWQGQVIAGNGLLMAAKKQGRKEIEIKDVSEWPEEKAISFMVADNRLAELSIIDDDLLSDLLTDFDEPLDIPGIDEDFLDDLDFGDDNKGGNTDLDSVPEDVEPVVKSGEFWTCGKHRLLCGDATKREDVERLMDGKKADMIFTDPPYGLGGYGGRKNMRLQGDDKDIRPFYSAIPEAKEIYVWGRIYNLVDLNFTPRDIIIWKKNNFIAMSSCNAMQISQAMTQSEKME